MGMLISRGRRSPLGPRLLRTPQVFRVLISVQRDRSRPACGRCQEQRVRELLFRGREEKTGRDWTQSVARPQAGSVHGSSVSLWKVLSSPTDSRPVTAAAVCHLGVLIVA